MYAFESSFSAFYFILFFVIEIKLIESMKLPYENVSYMCNGHFLSYALIIKRIRNVEYI